MRQKRLGIVIFMLAAFLPACSRKTIAVPPALASAASDNSYLDLRSGSTLKIVLPLLKSSGSRPVLGAQHIAGNTVSMKADDLVGYMTIRYAVEGKHGLVHLKWIAAQRTTGDQSLPVDKPPVLPFQLPRKAEYIRLIYLVRVSEADHDMAIVGSERLDRLNFFTAGLKQNPALCRTNNEVFCSWVPPGIAVRPEQ